MSPHRIGWLVVLAVLAAPGAASADAPLPQNDPFYAVPHGISQLRNGTILKSRSVAVSTAGVPLPVRAWQLEYKSEDVDNRPTAMVTTVMVPTAPWTRSGTRPLVSYQVAEDGAGTQCAASYALDGGLAAGQSESNAYGETGLIASVLEHGFAVVAPDYEGPDSHFLAAPEEAHGVLDSIRATLVFRPAGFGTNTRVGMMGYSGGGYATAVAALYQARYAPELHLLGAAIGSPAASVKAEVTAFDGTVAGGAIAMSIAALERAYPGAHLDRYLNAAGKQAVAATAHDCLAAAAAREPFGRLESWEAFPNALESRSMMQFLSAISPEFMPGNPQIPVLLYHDRTDEFAPVGPALDMVHRWCHAGTPVQVHVEPVGEHIAYESVGQPLALSWLDGRFARQPLVTACHAPPLQAVTLSARTLRVDRHGWVVLSLHNPNATRVTVTMISLRARGHALVNRRLRLRVGAYRSRAVRVKLGRTGLRRLARTRIVQVVIAARAADGRSATASVQRRLAKRR